MSLRNFYHLWVLGLGVLCGSQSVLASPIKERLQIKQMVKAKTAEVPLTGKAWELADAAFISYNRKDYGTALTLVEQALRLRPDVTRLWLLNVYSLQNLGKIQEALEVVDRAKIQGHRDERLNSAKKSLSMMLRESTKDVATTVDTMAWKWGDAAYKQYAVGGYEEAERLARKSLSAQPNNPNLRSLLVYALDKQDKNAEAAAEAEIALQRTPNDEVLQALRDRMYRRLAPVPATAAWNAYRDNDYLQAAQLAQQAVTQAPDVHSYQYLLAGALLAAGEYAQAESASSNALLQDADDALSLVMRGYSRQKLGRTEEARTDLARAVAQDWLSEQQLATVKRIADDTLRQSRGDSVRAANRSAPVVFCSPYEQDVLCSLFPAGSSLTGTGPGYAAATSAYDAQSREAYAVAAEYARQAAQAEPNNISYRLLLVNSLSLSGQEKLAHEEFQPIVAGAKISPDNLLDAAYAAQRLSFNTFASTLFSQAVDASDDDQIELSQQSRLNVRSAVSQLDRTWGFNAALGYGTVGVENPAFAPSLNKRRTLQSSVEAYWRPPGLGLRDGRVFELYGRLNHGLYDGTGGSTGAATAQGVLGGRWKPLKRQNFVFAVERFVPIGSDSRSDWLLRTAWSEGEGGGLRMDKSDWRYWQLYAEADYFIENPQVLGTIEARYGHAFLVERNFTITPYAVLNANYDELMGTRSTVGVGPGLNMRFWFREDKYRAPQSFVDFNVQYRFAVAGDDRSNGIFAGLYFSY